MANAIVRTSIKKRNGEGLDELNLYLASLKKELEELTKKQSELDARIYEISDSEWNEETAKINKGKKKLVKEISEAKSAVDELKRTINDDFISLVEFIANTRDPEKDYTSDYEQTTTLANHLATHPRLILDALKLSNPYGYTASKEEPKEEPQKEAEEAPVPEAPLKRTRKKASSSTKKTNSKEAPEQNPGLTSTNDGQIALNLGQVETQPTSENEAPLEPNVPTPAPEVPARKAPENFDVAPKEPANTSQETMEVPESHSTTDDQITINLEPKERLAVREKGPKAAPAPEITAETNEEVNNSGDQLTIESLLSSKTPETQAKPEEPEIEVLDVAPAEPVVPKAKPEFSLPNIPQVETELLRKAQDLAKAKEAPIETSKLSSHELLEQIANKAVASSKPVLDQIEHVNISSYVRNIKPLESPASKESELSSEYINKYPSKQQIAYKDEQPENLWDEDAAIKQFKQAIKAKEEEIARLNAELARKEQEAKEAQEKIAKTPSSSWINYNPELPALISEKDDSIKSLEQSIEAQTERLKKLAEEQRNARLDLETSDLESLQSQVSAYENIDYDSLSTWSTYHEDKTKMPTDAWKNYNPALPAVIANEDVSIKTLKDAIAKKEAEMQAFMDALAKKIENDQKEKEAHLAAITKLTNSLQKYLEIKLKDEEIKAKRAEEISESYASETEYLEGLQTSSNPYEAVDYENITEYNISDNSKGVVLDTNKIDKLKIYNAYLERNQIKKQESKVLLDQINKTPTRAWINLDSSLPSVIYDDPSIAKFKATINKKLELEKIKADLARVKDQKDKAPATITVAEDLHPTSPKTFTSNEERSEEVERINAFLAELEAKHKGDAELLDSIKKDLDESDTAKPEGSDISSDIDKVKYRREKVSKLNKMLNAISSTAREVFTNGITFTPHGHIDSEQILNTIKYIEGSDLDFLGRSGLTRELYKTDFEKAVGRHLTLIISLEKAISSFETFVKQENKKISNQDLEFVENRIVVYRRRVNSVRKDLASEFAKQYYKAIEDQDRSRAKVFRDNILGVVGINVEDIKTLEEALTIIEESPIDDKEKISSLKAEEQAMRNLDDALNTDSTQSINLIRKLREQYTKFNNGRNRG